MSLCFRICFIAFASLGALPSFAAEPVRPQQESADAVSMELGNLDAVYRGMPGWIVRLRDPRSGGFYETLGLRRGLEDKAYGPDIQSTHFAVLILRECGLTDSMPDSVRAGLVDYFRSRQDPDTGYFVDPDYPEMKDDARTMGRALMFARSTLRNMGGEPKYPLPGARTSTPATAAADDEANKADAANRSAPPAHVASVEAFRAWLDARPWEDAWTALDQLASQARLITLQAPELRDALVGEALRNVGARQDPDTGLIGGGSLIVRLSGAFKLTIFCDMVGRSMPGADRLWESTLGWYRNEPKTDKIFLIRNPAELLWNLSKMTGRKLSADELSLVLAVSRRELERYRQADGGFSSFAGKYYIGPNDLYMKPRKPARAGPQGDLNGTASAWALRRSLYRLAGVPPPRIEAEKDFWQRAEPDGGWSISNKTIVE